MTTRRHHNNHVPDSSKQQRDSLGLAEWQRPTTGLLSVLPLALVPYGELMRLHKPAGYFAFYFPHLVGFLFAQAVANPDSRLPVREQAVRHCCILAGSLFLRGAACTWNDTLDAPYDRRVTRCRLRPIARGAVSRGGGICFTVIQTVAGLAVGLLHLPDECWMPAAILTATQLVYPLFKRFTDYPQLWLGFSFGFGLGVGAGAGDLPFKLSGVLQQLGTSGTRSYGPGIRADQHDLAAALACLYAAGVLNTLIYDTIYGHQDLQDDVKAGVKSLAVAWRDDTKRNCAVLAAVEVLLYWYVGSILDLGVGFHTFAVMGTALVLFGLIYRVRLNEPSSCMSCFNQLIYGTGLMLALALAVRDSPRNLSLVAL